MQSVGGSIRLLHIVKRKYHIIWTGKRRYDLSRSECDRADDQSNQYMMISAMPAYACCKMGNEDCVVLRQEKHQETHPFMKRSRDE